MSEPDQRTLSDTHKQYYILNREVKSETKLECELYTDKSRIDNVSSLVESVLSQTNGTHSIDELDIPNYLEDWIQNILEYSIRADYGQNMPDHIEQNLEHVAETFRDSMNTSAKADGKYVVFIISNNQMVVCHSYTGKHALTTGMDIVEELLSEGNIDKYANFTLNESGEISVQHFDKYDTKSFADWLGLPDDDIVFDIKGSVRINLEIDGLEGVLEVDEEEVTNKLVKNDSYDISDNVLKLPNESNKSISSIRWGTTTTKIQTRLKVK